jgi:regulatory protein
VVARLKLRVGEPVDGDRLREVAVAEDLHRAMDVSLRYLETRARTQREIELRLARDGYGEDVIARVVEKLIALGLIDDAQFAAQWIESKTRLTSSRLAGKRRLSSDLSRKGVDKETIEEAVASVDEDVELDLARAALRSKIKALPSEPEALFAEKRRLASFLARRGFGWDVVSKVLREIAPDD